MDIGSNTAKVVELFLSSGSEPEQGYKSCASLTRLAERYDQDKVKADKDLPSTASVGHGITRGASYFAKGGERS